MVTVTQRPQGIKIIDQSIEATITDSSGDALVTFVSHSLTTGDYILIESDIDEYNGIWTVETISTDTFKILGTGYVPYYQDADITYYQTQTHEWSSAFLPIVYKATNNRWPVNTVDSVVTVTSQADDNGFTLLNITAPTGAFPLEYVKLSDGNVYQVVENGSGTTTINLAYDAANTFTSAQKYYNSYQVKVKIYAGLEAGQYWEAQKPFQVVATLSLTPDGDNNVMFSVSEYVQSLLKVRNNPLLFSLPLNLDAFTAFRIETAESFDISDGYTLATQESTYAVDAFTGYAIAGQLPFKNRYSGYMSEYVTTSGAPAKWLNTLTTLMGVVGNYFDLSFIKNIAGDFQIIIDKYANGYRYETETISYTDFGKGVYRIPLTFVSEYDKFCIRAYTPGTPGVDPPAPPTLQALNDWVALSGPFWTVPPPNTSVNGSGGIAGFVGGTIAAVAGEDHDFTIEYEISGGSDPINFTVHIALLDGALAELDWVEFTYTTLGIKNESFTLNPPSTGTYLAVRCVNNTPVNTKVIAINDVEFTGFTGGGTGIPAIPAQNLTEEICIDVYEVCEFDDGALIQPARRLTEDGGFRLLED